jgi:transcriptional regulator
MDMKKLGRKSFIWCTVVHGRAGWKQRDKNQPPLISEKDAYSHLPSIQKTIRHQGKQIKITPCYCLNCGYEFKNRKSFKKPGKCPECRQSRIEPAVFEIIAD